MADGSIGNITRLTTGMIGVPLVIDRDRRMIGVPLAINRDRSSVAAVVVALAVEEV